MNNGILSMDAEQYRAADGTANSDLKWISPPYTPAHFRAFKDGLIERAETEAMTVGTITHRAILEPETMAGAFVTRPEGMKFTTKEGKAWKEAQTLPIIDQRQADLIACMIQSVWKHKEAKQIILASKREQCLFAEDDGLLLKGRLDCLPNSGNIIADLKTCELCDMQSVEKSIVNYGYHRQAAFYLRLCKLLGLDKTQFVFIFVEKTAPHCVSCWTLDDEALSVGRQEIDRDLTVLKHCVETNTWPGREGGINCIGLPTWALKAMAATV
jgi:hypothetical protein